MTGVSTFREIVFLDQRIEGSEMVTGGGMRTEEENNRLKSSSSGLLRLCDVSSILLDTEKEGDSHEIRGENKFVSV